MEQIQGTHKKRLQGEPDKTPKFKNKSSSSESPARPKKIYLFIIFGQWASFMLA
jgi:hypothetical protein